MLNPVEDEEVKRALFHLHPAKSLGPDGMTPGFCHRYWSIVSQDIINLVKIFFSTGALDDHLTATSIFLIPEKKCPTHMTDLWPIYLCIVTYKNNLQGVGQQVKRVIDKVISHIKNAFIPDRLITDNVMISYEVMHFVKSKKKGKSGWNLLNLDMSKAYYCVKSRFL